MTDLLAGVSRRRPVLLVLEDGHWADAPDALLLRHLARARGRRAPAAARDVPRHRGRRPGRSAETLADLRRSDDVVRLRLAGLSGDEVTEFVRARRGRRADAGLPELAQAISDLTDGNAFLVCELWRALVETGIVEVVDGTIRLTRPLADLGTPESVREVVGQRLARLRARDHRPARAGGHGRSGVRARRPAPRRRAPATRAAGRASTRRSTAG